MSSRRIGGGRLPARLPVAPGATSADSDLPQATRFHPRAASASAWRTRRSCVLRADEGRGSGTTAHPITSPTVCAQVRGARVAEHRYRRSGGLLVGDGTLDRCRHSASRAHAVVRVPQVPAGGCPAERGVWTAQTRRGAGARHGLSPRAHDCGSGLGVYRPTSREGGSGLHANTSRHRIHRWDSDVY